MKPIAIAAGAALVGLAGVALMMRGEIRREYRILRMDTDPTMVGESLTTQGNALAYRQSDKQRKHGRSVGGVAPSRPIDPRMPDLD